MLLCIKDKLYLSDIRAIDIRFHHEDDFIKRLHGIIERIPVSKCDNARYSSEKLVHNSKYYLLSLMKDLDNEEVIKTVKYIVSNLSKDRTKKRLYIETVLFDTFNQLFEYAKVAGKLILDIYEKLDSDLSHDMDCWLQRSKSIYRIYPKNYLKLKTAYPYAKKASLICSLLAKLCSTEKEQHDYEIEAITNSETAITSTFFKINRKNPKGELSLGKRSSYFHMILKVCDTHSDTSKDLQIA